MSLITLHSRGNNTPEFIAKICDSFIAELEKRDLTKYVNSILTAHVVKTPPDHEAGLALLLRLRGNISFQYRISEVVTEKTTHVLTDSDPSVVEEAVKYIIFLVDANQLFDTALGMYDFSLVIMIAQHAQKVTFYNLLQNVNTKITINFVLVLHSRTLGNIFHSSVNSVPSINTINDSGLMTT